MKTAAIYCRVSTEEQVGNTSLRGQLEACREYATRQGYLVTKEVQEDFSGARLDRPGLTEIRDMVAQGELQALVVYEADRLSRVLGHLLLLQEEFDRLSADLLFVNSQDDTASPEGKMFFQMRGAFVEYERTKITERFRLGKMRMAKQGKVIGNTFKPLGYRFEAGEYIIIEEEACIVRQIFEWVVLDRLSIRQVGLRLTQQGAHTKRGNAHWGPPTVKGILDNPAYAGTACWNRHESIKPKQQRADTGPRKYEKTSKRVREATEWVRVPCPPIVSEELWQAAQEQLQTNKRNSPRNTKRAYLLRGLIKCGNCGYRYYGRGTRGHHYYYCGGGESLIDPRKAAYTGQKCPSKPLRADRIEARVWDYVKEQITDEEKLTATFELRDGSIEAELRRDQGELESLYAAEGRLAGERNKMLDLYTQDLITKDLLQERLVGIQKRAESLEETKADVMARIDRRKTATATTDAIREFCRLVRTGLERAQGVEGVDYRRELLEMLDTELVVDGEQIHVSGIITGTLPLFDGGVRLLCSDDAPLQV